MYIPPKLLFSCFAAGALYLLLIELALGKLEKRLARMGLWENYPAELMRGDGPGARSWNLITQFVLFTLVPTLTYAWFYLLLPFEGARSGVAVGLWAVAIGAAPLAILLGTRLRLPYPALAFFVLGLLIKLCGSLAIIGFLFSL